MTCYNYLWVEIQTVYELVIIILNSSQNTIYQQKPDFLNLIWHFATQKKNGEMH